MHFHRRKAGKESPKGPILNVFQGDKIHWFLEPYFTEASRAERSEISEARGNQDPAEPGFSHRAANRTNQERSDPLTQIGPSLETDS